MRTYTFATILVCAFAFNSQSAFSKTTSSKSNAKPSKQNVVSKINVNKKSRGKTMQEKIEEERRRSTEEEHERLLKEQKNLEELEKLRKEKLEKESQGVQIPKVAPVNTPAPTSATPQPQKPQQQQQSAPMIPTVPVSPEMQEEYRRFPKASVRGDSNGNYGGTEGSGGYKGAKCSLPNLDYSKFNKKWGKALLDRMSGSAPVQTENGAVLNGPMDFMRTGRALAADIGCPSIDPNDHDQANYIVAALVIAMACPESGWNPTTSYDERRSGGVAGSDWSLEANESRGLLQMTMKSDRDSANGCVLRSQSDLNGPITNLMCGLAKIKKRGYTRVVTFGEYWSVARKMTKNIKAAVRRECQAGYPNIKAYINEDSSGANTPSFQIQNSNTTVK